MRVGSGTRLVVLASLALVGTVGAGCGGSDAAGTAPATPPGAGGDEIAIKEYAFAPATSSVRVGDTVRFKNLDRTEHTATVAGMDALDTGTIKHGDAGSIRFTKPGRFTYICVFHPYMKGTVVVTTP